MSGEFDIQGSCDPRVVRCADAFRANFAMAANLARRAPSFSRENQSSISGAAGPRPTAKRGTGILRHPSSR